MWNHANDDLPHVFTFNQKYSFIRELFRDNLFGGLTSVMHRHLDLSGTDSPFAARHVPNGNLLSHVIFLDFNRLVSLVKIFIISNII